jgi:DNA-directed RNA polymerase specialized sigma24 family protein/transcriptional regulator with XRE-family HTH domain
MSPAERHTVGVKLMGQYDFVVRTLIRFGIKNETADAAQEVLLTAVRRWDDYRPGDDIEAWLTGICRRVASNVRRKKRRRPAELWDTPPLVTVASHEGRIEARSVLASLPDHMGPILRALSDNGCMLAPAARDLGIDEATLHARLVAIRKGERIEPIKRTYGLRDIGLMLIMLRIARGLTQRQLAEHLEVHESQVSRDERTEYQGVTVDRAARTFDALEARVRLEVENLVPLERPKLREDALLEAARRAPLGKPFTAEELSIFDKHDRRDAIRKGAPVEPLISPKKRRKT